MNNPENIPISGGQPQQESPAAAERPLDARQVWQDASGVLRAMLKPDLFHLWFEPVTALALDGDQITLGVSNDFCAIWLTENYQSLIEDALAHAASRRLTVGFQIEDRAPAQGHTPATRTADPRDDGSALRETRDQDETDTGADNGSAAPELAFNPKNTFETFIVGDNNSFAHAAALAVAKNPGKSYNPLFLYGGTGLGKTHLLHAIGQYVAEHRRRPKVTYLSSEKFTNDYIAAIKDSRLERFRKRYRQCDLLLIDDIQFLAGKERIQEEFFHTFNALREAQKQIVLTCDRPATEIQNLEHRLVSRFEWGLVTDLQPPPTEVRVAILRQKEKSLGVSLPDDVVNFIADRIRTNIRRLEGALIRVASYVSLTGASITVERAESMLRELLYEEGRQTVSVDQIQRHVAKHFDLRLADMSSKRRPENIAFPRQIAMYLSRELTEQSLQSIGELFGGRDHGTVLYAYRTVRSRMEVDEQIRQTVNYLRDQLQR